MLLKEGNRTTCCSDLSVQKDAREQAVLIPTRVIAFMRTNTAPSEKH